MWLIRKEQRAALAALHNERFVDKAVRDLAELFPGDARLRDEAATRAEIAEAVQRAAEFGLEGAREVSLYVYLTHDLGPGFPDDERTRWIGAVLRDRTLPGPAKMDVVYTRLEAASRKRAP